MSTLIDTLVNDGNTILPRTVAKAVTMEDGTSLEAFSKDIPTDNIKITTELAEATGRVAGTTLSALLIDHLNNTANVLAVAEVIE